MFRAFIDYLSWLHRSKQNWIDQEFFEPMLSGAAAACRLCLGAACLLFFVSWYGNLSDWIAASGPLNRETILFLILDGVDGSGSAFRISPLFWNEGFIAQTILLVCGTISSLVLVTGYGGRVVPILVWVLMLSILHRVSPIQTHGELLLCSIVPYLAIDNGWLTLKNRVGFADNEKRWTTRLMVGLLRWHLILWLLGAFASHLSQEMWWNGTAMWKVAVNGVSPILTPQWMTSYSWLSPFLGALWLILHAALIMTLFFSKLRPLAIPIALLFWLGVYLLNGDTLYALVGLAACSCVFYESTITVQSVLREPTKA